MPNKAQTHLNSGEFSYEMESPMSNLKSQIANHKSGALLLDPAQLAALAALANGIIPADNLDAGAAEVNAATKIAEKIASGINAAVYAWTSASGFTRSRTLQSQCCSIDCFRNPRPAI